MVSIVRILYPPSESIIEFHRTPLNPVPLALLEGGGWREWRTPSIRFAVWLSANGDLSTRSRHNISRVIIESRIGENGGRGLQMIGSPNYRTWSTRLVASRSSLYLSLSLCLPPSLCARIISILSHRVCRLLTLWWTACWRKYNVPRAPKFLGMKHPLYQVARLCPGRRWLKRDSSEDDTLMGRRAWICWKISGGCCALKRETFTKNVA